MRTPLLALTLLTASCGLFSGPAVKPVQLVNGFDFPLTITLTSEGGSETSYELAPKARVGLDVSGRYTVSAKKADGTEVDKKTANFASSSERKDGCVEFFNPGGAAYYVAEEIQYGDTTYAPKMSTIAGKNHATLCATWGLDVDQPPEAISTSDQYAMSKTYKWMHEGGDGTWVSSIEHLLADQERNKPADNSSMIRAWNVAIAIHKHDRGNPRLAALGPKFHHACKNALQDFFTSGPLVGEQERKCLDNHAAIFPGG